MSATSFLKPYPALRDFVEGPEQRTQMIRDAMRTVELEIRKKRGLWGATLKGAYRIGTTLAPRYVENLTGKFFEPALDVLTPFFHEALDLDRSLPVHFEANAERLIGALLEITDAHSAQDRDGPLKRAYASLRGRMEAEVRPSIQPLGELVERHLPPQWTPGNVR